MKIYFLRHGEAGMRAASDFQRELTETGIRDSKNVGLFCKNNSIHFTHVLASPLVRAKQTAELVVSSLPPVNIELSDFLTPDADPRNLLSHLRAFTSESQILCVTHEPFVSTCISTLIDGSASVHIVMKPASFACVETDGVPARGNGKLLWLQNPQILTGLVS